MKTRPLRSRGPQKTAPASPSRNSSNYWVSLPPKVHLTVTLPEGKIVSFQSSVVAVMPSRLAPQGTAGFPSEPPSFSPLQVTSFFGTSVVCPEQVLTCWGSIYSLPTLNWPRRRHRLPCRFCRRPRIVRSQRQAAPLTTQVHPL